MLGEVILRRLQARVACNYPLLVVGCLIALIECCEYIVVFQGDVVRRVDDTQLGTAFAAKLRVNFAGSLLQDACVIFVIAGQRGTSLLDDLLISLVSCIIVLDGQFIASR